MCSALVGWPGDILSIEHSDDRLFPETSLAVDILRWGLDNPGPTTIYSLTSSYLYFYLYFPIHPYPLLLYFNFHLLIVIGARVCVQSHACSFPNASMYIRCPPTSRMEYASFPHFLGISKAPSWWLKIPQDYHTHECNFYDKYLVSTVMGQDSLFLKLFPFLYPSALVSGPHQWATLLSSTIALDFLILWLFFFVFTPTLILIRPDHDYHFTSLLILDNLFLSFSSHTRTLCFICVRYLWHFSHVPDAFSLFILTLVAMTGQPRTASLGCSKTPSTLVQQDHQSQFGVVS